MKLKSLSITALLAVISMGCTMDDGKRFLYFIGRSYACQYQTEDDPQERVTGGECVTSKPSYEAYKGARREQLEGKSTDGKKSNPESGTESREQ